MKKFAKLNLDPDFDPFENESAFELKYKSFIFPGGEPHIKIENCVQSDSEFIFDGEIVDIEDVTLVITQRFNSVADMFAIVQAVDAVKRIGFKKIQLVLPYFPGARQDRVCNAGESLTVKVFANMINNCDFEKVFIFCPHSDVTPALINNVELIDLESAFLENIIYHTGFEYLHTINIVCPDAGAGKRVSGLAKKLIETFPKLTINLIRCEKERDIATGELKSFYVQTDDLGGAPTIICDDIVAKGGTFIGLGNELRKKNCGDLILYTCHADFDEGLLNMSNFFTSVYTSNSKSDSIPMTDSENIYKFKITV